MCDDSDNEKPSTIPRKSTKPYKNVHRPKKSLERPLSRVAKTAIYATRRKERECEASIRVLEEAASIREKLKEGTYDVEEAKCSAQLQTRLDRAEEALNTKAIALTDNHANKTNKRSNRVDDGDSPSSSNEVVAFIPDYDPELTIDENINNVKYNPGIQARFLQSTADEVLYAGSRGSGKSSAFILDPLRFCSNRNFRGLIIRKAMPDLADLISRCQILYKQAFPGVKYQKSEKVFVFPSGAKIYFGYADSLEDLERYRGQEYTWIGIDEVAQYPGDWIIERLKASMRTSDPSLPIYLRCSCNPMGVGKGWVQDRWKIEHNMDSDGNVLSSNAEEVQTKYYNTPLGDFPITRVWFHSNVLDNRALIYANPRYVATLAAQTNETVRAQELYGSWDAVEGLAFPEFRKNIHVVDNFTVPPNWYRWRACDYGYSTMGVCLWLAADWDNNIYVYRELATTKVNVEDFARKVLELESGETVSAGYIDGSLYSRRGEIGEAPADTMARVGVHWIPADRSPHSRVASKLLIHKYLANDHITGIPRLKIQRQCKELIQELSSLQADPLNSEDIDRSRKHSLPDHAFDALRYGLQAMPETAAVVPDPFLDSFRETDRFEPIDPVIGI